MDPERFRAAYARLERLDERHAYKLRPRNRSIGTRARPEHLEQRVADLSDYALELREIVGELFEAIAGKPSG